MTASKRNTADLEPLLTRIQRLNDSGAGAHQNDPVLGTSDVMAAQWHREHPELDLGAFELALRVRRLAMLLDEQLSLICKSLDVTFGDFLLLMALRRLGPDGSLRPTDIVKMHSVTSGTVAYRIDRLVSQRFVERMEDPADLRSYLIRLADHGREIVDQGVRRFSELNSTVLRDMMEIDGASENFIELLRLYENRMEAVPVPPPPQRRRRAKAS
jgi:DNA-binding MarR family transcriptional regulator